MALTITEALAEIKTITKRIASKREFVKLYLVRQEMLKDPHEKDGGSVSAIKAALQAIRDLEERQVLIRRRINEANIATTITVNGQTRSLADWLIWRRDIAPKRGEFVNGLASQINANRQQATKQGLALVSVDAAKSPTDVVVNLNEQELASWREEHDALLEVLDGQLSLKNATVTIEV